jgi:hypothetical protein
MLVAFWDGWRRSSGELRQHFSWLLGSFALFWVVSYATYLEDFFRTGSQALFQHAAVLGSLLALVGLTYAILRHRVLDMGLALNRSPVFTVVGTVLLGSFQFLQVVTGRLLHFDDPAKAGLVSDPCWPASWCSPTRRSSRARSGWSTGCSSAIGSRAKPI